LRTFKQTARGAATRRLLLDSTIECLVLRGYGGASTTAICGQAGLTAGALFGQFPSKTALLVEVATDLVSQAAGQLEAALAELPRIPSEALTIAFDQLMDVWQSPEVTALNELWTAARTEPELARALMDANVQEEAALADLNQRLLGSSIAPEAVPALAQVLIYSVSRQTLIDHAVRKAGGDPASNGHSAIRSTLAALGQALERSHQ
jgi:AcrR family transcriptional regulator